MNTNDQQPTPCLFVAANDEPEQSWRDVGRLLLCDLGVAALVLAGWAAFGLGTLWAVTR